MQASKRPVPLVSGPMRPEPGWFDYNGHLNMAYYHVLFDRAADEVHALVGLGPDYARERGGTTFAAEVHVRYLREVTGEAPLCIELRFLDHDEKRLHVFQEMRHAEERWLAATCECLSLHVDTTTRRVAPFPPDVAERLAVLKAAHDRLPRPEGLGRAIGIPPRAPA